MENPKNKTPGSKSTLKGAVYPTLKGGLALPKGSILYLTLFVGGTIPDMYDILLLTSGIPVIIGTSYLSLERKAFFTPRPNLLRHPSVQDSGIHLVPIAHEGY